MTEQALTLAVHVRAGDPRVPLAPAHFFEQGPKLAQRLHRLRFAIAFQLHEHARAVRIRNLGQRREGSPILARGAQDVESRPVEILKRARAIERGANSHDEIERLALILEKAINTPGHLRSGHQRELKLRDDAESAVGSDEQVHGVHVVRDEIARRVLCARHVVGRELHAHRGPLLRDELQRAALRAHVASAQRQRLPAHEHHAQSAHVRTHGTVPVTTRTGCIACGHAAQTGGRLRGIRGEELLGAGVERLKRRARSVIPAMGGQALRMQVTTQFR